MCPQSYITLHQWTCIIQYHTKLLQLFAQYCRVAITTCVMICGAIFVEGGFKAKPAPLAKEVEEVPYSPRIKGVAGYRYDGAGPSEVCTISMQCPHNFLANGPHMPTPQCCWVSPHHICLIAGTCSCWQMWITKHFPITKQAAKGTEECSRAEVCQSVEAKLPWA
jgi:hypothetical protein